MTLYLIIIVINITTRALTKVSACFVQGSKAMAKVAVVFIHGFCGGTNTWQNSNNQKFYELLKKEHGLKQLGYFEFDYYTQILNLKNNIVTKVVAGIINKMIPGGWKKPVVKKNTPISDIAQLLLTFLKHEVKDYTNIILIGHSMGGLVAKNVICEVLDGNCPDFEQNIIGYCSIATPHLGSLTSVLLGPLNINAKEMVPLNEHLMTLNHQWLEIADQIPKALYIIAKSDEVVPQASATPSLTKSKFPTEMIEADHTSICKPNSKNETIFKVVKTFIKKTLSVSDVLQIGTSGLAFDSSSYDKETFVIKLVLAGVDQELVTDAKESFFFSEIVEKKASKAEREKIMDLSNRIISLYRTIKASGKTKTSTELVSKVHEKIIDTDKDALSCAIQYLNFFHKQGFLHAQANKNNLNVNWDSRVTLDAIDKLRGESE